MPEIRQLSKETIDRIAAGECIERPAAVVKELVENAIDAGARAVTVEIREGGSAMLRVTDDGCGIAPDEVRRAFLPHATSKLTQAEDLSHILTLGFRGEALSSIAAVSKTEMITKRAEDAAATRYTVWGGTEQSLEEVGAPDGTTVIVRDLFYNTPARLKFLRTSMTEAAHIGSLMEMLALSHPEIAFQFLSGGQAKLMTNGSGSLRDVIYAVYGRSVTSELLPAEGEEGAVRISGFIAKPSVMRSNRQFENYFINGRYVKNAVISRAVEEGYSGRLMQRSYPFTCLVITIDPEEIDVNVHPAKMEVRFSDEQAVYRAVRAAVRRTLDQSVMIVPAEMDERPRRVTTAQERKEAYREAAEPFEKQYKSSLVKEEGSYGITPSAPAEDKGGQDLPGQKDTPAGNTPPAAPSLTARTEIREAEQLTFLSPEEKDRRRIIGQAFGTYWLCEYRGELLVIDQHAAHEKVLYERFMKQYAASEIISQPLRPAVIFTASSREEEVLAACGEAFTAFGFMIEPFGERTYKISAVPYNFGNIPAERLLREILDRAEFDLSKKELPAYVHAIATEACKAAVKGGDVLDPSEAETLIGELMTLDDPWHCPHGRPTVIRFTKQEFEKKFKRIV
ncbi:MAG: DNA mismatch repair endonuclease MutL [Lachnospiraceae bacterium]|nr:DNA mismatch repair endonuclease MutL [Lachnospiraceae bacterium]